jgi:hypothetical protein
LAANSQPGYAVSDEALFDDDAIVSTTGDVRSVGEMLLDVDYLARQLLMDVTGGDAAPLVRGWPDVVAAASDLWTALPVRRSPVTGESETHHMDRLQSLAAGIQRNLGTGWPGPGSSDPRTTQIATTLTHAARLVQRYAEEIPAERTVIRQDVDAARARIMHGLYLTAHALGVSLHQRCRDRHRDALAAGRPLPLSTRHSPYAGSRTAPWIRRLAMCESAAAAYVDGRFAPVLAGEAPRPLEDPGRLQRALTAWDIQAHRTLASAPTPTEVLLVARTQGLIAGAGLVLLDAAVRADLLPSATTTERLLPALNAAGRAWTHLASRWSDLTTPAPRLDGDLVRAATEVRAASRELTHDTTTMASLEEIAARPGLDTATGAILHALETGAEIAYVVAELADNPHLTGPARALSIRAHNDVESGVAAPHPAPGDIVWVAPGDIVTNRHVLLPPPVAEALRRAGVTASHAADAAAAAAAPVGLEVVSGARRCTILSHSRQREANTRPGATSPSTRSAASQWAPPRSR